jgi:hypothetical protein
MFFRLGDLSPNSTHMLEAAHVMLVRNQQMYFKASEITNNPVNLHRISELHEVPGHPDTAVEIRSQRMNGSDFFHLAQYKFQPWNMTLLDFGLVGFTWRRSMQVKWLFFSLSSFFYFFTSK